MSLIPSESASFPDLLGRGLGASKKSKWRVPHVLDQPAPPPPKIEPLSEPTPAAPMIEEGATAAVSETTGSDPLSSGSGSVELPVTEEPPPLVSEEKFLPTDSKTVPPAPSGLDFAFPEAPAEKALPPGSVEKTSGLINSDLTPIEPLLPAAASLQFIPKAAEEAPHPQPIEKTSDPVGSVLTPIEPLLPLPTTIESCSDAPVGAPGTAETLPPVNSDLAQLAALLASADKFEPISGAPPPADPNEASFDSKESEVTALEPLSPIQKQSPPSDAVVENVPHSVSSKAESNPPALSGAAPAAEKRPVERPAPIPIRPIARSNSTPAATTGAIAPAEAVETEAEAPLRSVVPPPRAPQAKPRLRPRPNLQPRFESDLVEAAPPDSAKPVSPTISPSPAPETPDSVTYLEYLAPDFSTPREDFQHADSAAEWPDVERRQRNKFFLFTASEILALAMLVGSVLYGWFHRTGSGLFSPAPKLFAILSAIAVAALPIIFYGFPKTLPREER